MPLKKHRFDKGIPVVALVDKGYFNAEQLDAGRKDGVITYVPNNYRLAEDAVPLKDYHLKDFSYHSKSDPYTCPKNILLLPTVTGA